MVIILQYIHISNHWVIYTLNLHNIICQFYLNKAEEDVAACFWLCCSACGILVSLSSVQLLSRVQLFATPWTACSTPGFPVCHQLPELAQTHVHRFSDTIQPSHPLLSPSPPSFSLSQYQGLFNWVSSLHQVAKVLQFQLLQHQSFQWTPRTNLL